MYGKVNIIIPSITISDELINCLKGIDQLNYKNFFVSIIIDHNNNKVIPKFKFKVNKLITGKMFMSKKRNLAAIKFKSKYIAFIDSDCYPCKDWLTKSLEVLSDKSIHVVGGPNIPFLNQSYSEKITSYCKRSFFISGHLSYRKYKSSARYCDDYLESCNLIMRKTDYLICNGMNEKIYIGEDKALFDDLKKKIKNFKAFFSPQVFVYHKQRKILKFLLQRLSYGTALISYIKPKEGFKGLISALPILSFFFLLIFLSTNLSITLKLIFIIFIIVVINIVIYFEINKFVKKFKDRLLTLSIINLCTIMHIIGSLITIVGLKRIFERKIYVLSRNDK